MTTTHQQITDLLDRHPCTYEHHPQLELRRIDLIASVTNQSRFEPIDTDTVDRYVAALDDGATFPPILVRHIPPATPKAKAQLIILGGNHRVRAHIDHGATTIDAYLVVCDDLTALELAYADNATHGLPPTKEEQLAHAMVLMDRGRSATQAARTVGIHEQQVHKHIALQRTHARAARLGVTDHTQAMPASTLHRLDSLKDDRVFTKVARTITSHQLGQTAVTRLVADINAQPDVASQMDYIGAFLAHHKAGPNGRGVGRPPQNPYLQLLTALGTIRALNPTDTIEACTSARDRRDLHDRLLAGARHLMAIDKLLEADTRPDLKVVR